MKRSLVLFVACFWVARSVVADGIVRPPREYKGSLEERSQEAIIVFEDGTETTSARQDLILKIQVEGEADDFAWVVPFPRPPEATKESADLFREVFDYIEAKRASRKKKRRFSVDDGAIGSIGSEASVDVISRELVGSYDVAVVRERKPNSLNDWLEREGFQGIEGGEGVIGHYHKKGYVFACIKVSDTKLASSKKPVELHPLRFTFETGGRDGIYFPMKLTGLQKEKFDVNLYVFRNSWINDDINKYGFTHREFRLKFRDWDSPRCKPNAGKNWSKPSVDPYLKPTAMKIPELSRFFAKHYPEKRFYLTNIVANNLEPARVRAWKDDLWLYPYYTRKGFVPFDARE